MKTKLIILTVCAAFIALGSCKQKEWIEWKVQNEIWLQQNAQKDSVVTTPSGLQYKILYEGNLSDAKPSLISTVYITYTGKLINGVVFDSHENASLNLQSSAIKGFAEGMTKIHKTGDIEIYIPWELGYQSDGNGAAEGYSSNIPPYSTLIFRVHLNGLTN